MIRLRTGFTPFTDSNFSSFSQHVIQSMTDNANYPDPLPALADVQAALDDYNTKLAATIARGTREDTVLKNQSRKALELLLQRLAIYVEQTTPGDEVKLLTSGFELSKQPSPVGEPLQPQNLVLDSGSLSGDVFVKFDKVDNAQSYQCRHMNGDAQWILSAPFSKSSSLISGLQPASTYTVQVRSSNAHGISEWSTPVSIIVR
jgi:Fibronectin type III domain